MCSLKIDGESGAARCGAANRCHFLHTCLYSTASVRLVGRDNMVLGSYGACTVFGGVRIRVKLARIATACTTIVGTSLDAALAEHVLAQIVEQEKRLALRVRRLFVRVAEDGDKDHEDPVDHDDREDPLDELGHLQRPRDGSRRCRCRRGRR